MCLVLDGNGKGRTSRQLQFKARHGKQGKRGKLVNVTLVQGESDEEAVQLTIFDFLF